MDYNSVLAAGGVERIGLDEAFIKVTLPNGEKKKIMHYMPDHKEGVNLRRSTLWVTASCRAATSMRRALLLTRAWRKVSRAFAISHPFTTLAT